MGSVMLALVGLSHLFIGYITFVSVLIWAPNRRTVRLVLMAGLLMFWFFIPMMWYGEVNRSRWDPAYKFDSYGAQIILDELLSGRLLDFGRWPILTASVGLGIVWAVVSADDLGWKLFLLAGVWLVLWCGRPTWGYLLPVPSQFHLHRLEAGFELFAILLAAWGVDRGIHGARSLPAAERSVG